MTPEVEAAVEEIRQAFSGHRIEVEPDGQGGAYVIVYDLPLGNRIRPEVSWCGFQIQFAYPRCDVYPHFFAELTGPDGGSMGQGCSNTTWRGRKVTQVSRRSNRWNPAFDTAAAKLVKVLEWLRGR